MIRKKKNNIKLNYKEVKKYIESFNDELLSKEYKNAHTKLEIKCKNKKHIYWVTWNNYHQGNRCRKCSYENTSIKRKLTLEYIKSETSKLAEGYICRVKKYKNVETKLPFTCNKGHEFWMTFHSFKSSNQRCPICWKESIKGKGHPNWKGGVKKLNIPLYDTYAHQINWIEKVKRDPKNKDYLQVKCTNSNCRKWFMPNLSNVKNRIKVLNNKAKYGENRFYCSEECKQSCSIYGQKKYPKKFKGNSQQRPDQKEWANLVKKRDNNICQICGKEGKIAHHFEGLNVNPIMSTDTDMGITLCKECDKRAHSNIGCRSIDLRKENSCNA